MSVIKTHPAYQYAVDVANGKEIANQHMKTVCSRFIEEIDKGKDFDYFLDEIELRKVTLILNYIHMATGLKEGSKVSESLQGFQWFFLVNILCWKEKKDFSKRRYEKATLLIGRKNSKTFLSAIIFILLLLTEPDFSELYSVAPDKELSKQIQKEMISIISKSHSSIRNKFKISQKRIVCLSTHNTFTPLANNKDGLDGREPTAYLVDETGALKDVYPIEAMSSGQTTVANPLGIIISTAYDTLGNPMTHEVQIAKDSLEYGKNYDPNYFSMLYYPDEPKKWADSEDEVMKANPLAQHIPKIKENVLKKWKLAISYPIKRSNFLTKYMNIFIDGDAGEEFVKSEDLLRGELHEDYEWNGKEVMVGVDFAQSRDNFGVTMVAYDYYKNAYVAKSWAIYAADREVEKTKAEDVNYHDYSKKGWTIPSGGPTIDYGEAEEFVENLEDKYGVKIISIAYDRWQARSSIAKFESLGYDCIDIPQNAKGLYPATKLLRESIENDSFYFDKNDFYVQNFLNSTMIVDSNMSYYLNKKKSKGKIDMVAATVDAMALWEHRNVENVQREHYRSAIF